MGKHRAAFEWSKLQQGEEIVGTVAGFVQDRSAFEGELILTDQRVCFYRKGMMGEVFESVPISKITSVEVRAILGFRKLKLYTSNDHIEFKVIGSKSDFDTFYSSLEARRADGSSAKAGQVYGASAPSAVQQSAVGAAPIDQLRQLGELRSAGVLSEDEFAAKKAEILARI